MKASHTGRRAGIALLIAVLAGCLAAGAAGSAATAVNKGLASTLGPSGLKFYTPPRNFPAGRHGTLIWERPFRGVAALRGAVNYLVLYKQVGIRGKSVAVSGIVSVPNGKAPKGGWPVVAYAHSTSGIADRCAPSRDTGPSSGADQIDIGIAPLLDRWIKNGYAIVRSDYEGLGGPGAHPFLIGRSEGHGVLDVVRAGRQLDPALSERVIIAGHSQGGHAALWAASLARSYTPELHLLGTVAFAPQSHTATEASLLTTQSSPHLTGLAAMIFRGADVAYPSLHVRSLLTAAGAKLYPQTLSRCLGSLDSTSSFGGLGLNQLGRPLANVKPLLGDIARNDPDSLVIRGPVLLEQGLDDTTVIPALDQALSQSLAKVGDSVTYHTYAGTSHVGVLIAAAGDATAFLKQRFGR